MRAVLVLFLPPPREEAACPPPPAQGSALHSSGLMTAQMGAADGRRAQARGNHRPQCRWE